jgi:cyclic di-GMP phosphodiesterase
MHFDTAHQRQSVGDQPQLPDACILVCDDDPSIQKVLDIGLSRAGCRTRVVSTAAMAIETLDSGGFDPDCVVLDIRMPGLSGIDAIPLLKQRDRNLQIIMLTALTDIEVGIEAMKNGAFDYLIKPVHRAQLVETIRKAVHYRKLEIENERLLRENFEYQKGLETKIEERTAELFAAYRKLQQTNLDTVKVLAETIEAKDHYTRGHCNRVRQLATRLYERWDPSKKEIETLEYGALLHDIGKIGIPEQLLNKNGRLDDNEYRIFNSHPVIGETILATIDFFQPCLPIVRSHHERFDGSGYPDGLAGEAILPLVRIVSIADSFDAMTSTRPYRTALPIDFAVKELERGKGAQFDPEFVEIFVRERVYEVLTAGQP